MASKEQVKTIHVLVKALQIEDDIYRAMLENLGAASSKDLSFSQAAALIGRLATDAKSAGVWTQRQSPKRYEHLDDRTEEWASPAQLRLIEGLWNDVSYVPAEERRKALRRFIERRFHYSALEFIPAKAVRRIVETLESMKAGQERKKQSGGKAA